MNHFIFKTQDELDEALNHTDTRISRGIIKNILDNLDSKSPFVAFTIVCEETELEQEYTINPEDMLDALERGLIIMENEEDFETCLIISGAIKYLKDKGRA